MNNQSREEYVAQDLASIIANQSLKISYLMLEKKQLQERNAQLQETINTLRKEGKHESSADHTADKQINQHSQ